jgi:hypothetical protein
MIACCLNLTKSIFILPETQAVVKKNWGIYCTKVINVFMKTWRHASSPISNLLTRKLHLLVVAVFFVLNSCNFFTYHLNQTHLLSDHCLCHIQLLIPSLLHLSVHHCGSSTTGFANKAGQGCHGGRTGLERTGGTDGLAFRVDGGWESWFPTNENITMLSCQPVPGFQSRDFR